MPNPIGDGGTIFIGAGRDYGDFGDFYSMNSNNAGGNSVENDDLFASGAENFSQHAGESYVNYIEQALNALDNWADPSVALKAIYKGLTGVDTNGPISVGGPIASAFEWVAKQLGTTLGLRGADPNFTPGNKTLVLGGQTGSQAFNPTSNDPGRDIGGTAFQDWQNGNASDNNGNNTNNGPLDFSSGLRPGDVTGSVFDGWENGGANANTPPDMGPINQVIPTIGEDGSIEQILVIGSQDNSVHYLTPDDLTNIGITIEQLPNFDMGQLDPVQNVPTGNTNPTPDGDLEEINVVGQKPDNNTGSQPIRQDTPIGDGGEIVIGPGGTVNDINVDMPRPPNPDLTGPPVGTGGSGPPVNITPPPPQGSIDEIPRGGNNPPDGGGGGSSALPPRANPPGQPTLPQFRFFDMPSFQLLPNNFGQQMIATVESMQNKKVS